MLSLENTDFRPKKDQFFFFFRFRFRFRLRVIGFCFTEVLFRFIHLAGEFEVMHLEGKLNEE